MDKSPVELRNEKLGNKVVRALEERYFEAYYCETKEQAREKILSLVPKGSSVSWGGSASMSQLGLQEAFHQEDYDVLDRDEAKDPKQRMEMMRKALLCDAFIMGTNALSEDGQLVNIDGVGNRVAAMSFGPKEVIVIAGINKIAKTLEDAVSRARNIAAPINAQRFLQNETPCTVNGSCSDCRSKGCICTYIVTTRRSNPPKRIKVIIVGENLGF